MEGIAKENRLEMKYYSEEKMGNLRLSFEEKILALPRVRTKKMFGCPCYQANGNLFAFLITNGVVITQLEEKDCGKFSREGNGRFFRAGKKTIRNWLRFSVENTGDVKRIMRLVRKSYGIALRKARTSKRVYGVLSNGT